MNTNPLIDFLSEILSRFKQTSPKFFQYFTWFGTILAALVYIPQTLQLFGIVLPDAWNTVLAKVLGAVGVAVAIMGKLTVSQATAVAQKTDALPFTETHVVPTNDQKAAAKKGS